MRRIDIDDVELTKWRNEHHALYASQTVNNQRLKMSINTNGVFSVTLGETELYCGADQSTAIEAYNNA